MVLKLPWAQLNECSESLEMEYFRFFYNLLVTKKKSFSVLKLHWAQKQMFWEFENGIFQFFADFWVTKLKPFSGKVRQNV